MFDKGYTPNWRTEKIFLVEKIQSTNPITYRLKDLNNEEIQGSFYEPELLLLIIIITFIYTAQFSTALTIKNYTNE